MTAEQDQKSRARKARWRIPAIALVSILIVAAVLVFVFLPYRTASISQRNEDQRATLAKILAEDEASSIPDGFYIVDDQPGLRASSFKAVALDGEPLMLRQTRVLALRDIAAAHESFDAGGAPSVAIKLKARAVAKMKRVSTENVGRRLAIVVNDAVITAPLIREPMQDALTISGTFTLEDARGLAAQLNLYGLAD